MLTELRKSDMCNPQYSKFASVWQKMRDSFEGEEQMKLCSLAQNRTNIDGKPQLKAITTFDQYLRPTDSMRRLGNVGYQRFCDYIYRAKFYPFPLEVKSQSLGLIQHEPAGFELPTQLEFMEMDATTNNESLRKVLSIVNSEQLKVSRVGLLLNPSLEDNKPFNIGVYSAETILDWNTAIDSNSELIINWLKLKTDEVDDEGKQIYLVLLLDEQGYYAQYKTINPAVKYGDLYGDDDGDILDSYVMPMASETLLTEIPFVIINVVKLGVEIERPFLESITDAAISLYRASAHHEDALYWGGESTLFTRGYGLAEDPPTIYVGNGATNISNIDYADAKYVTMGTDGIAPREKNVEKLFDYCVTLGVDLLNKGTESGVALDIRSNVKTASLKTLSLTAAHGFETLLKIGAVWLGANPDEVIVTANTTFADTRYTAEDFSKFATIVELGQMRQRDYYNLQVKHRLTNAENFEEWRVELEKPTSDIQ